VAGNAVAVVWKQAVSGSDQLPLLFTGNIANGLPAMYDTVDMSNITNADVALTNGNIFVVWEDDNSGTIKYRTGTFTPVNTSVNEITQNNFSVYSNPVTEFIYIKHEKADNMIVSVKDVIGQQVFLQQNLNSQSNIQINTSAWNSGIYFVTVQNAEAIQTQKILVLHQ